MNVIVLAVALDQFGPEVGADYGKDCAQIADRQFRKNVTTVFGDKDQVSVQRVNHIAGAIIHIRLHRPTCYAIHMGRIRGYVYRLAPDAAQARQFAQFAGVCRLVWNLALEQRQDHARRYRACTGNSLSYIGQARELTALRAEVDFVRAVHVTPLQRTIKALDEAYRRAWSGLGSFPRPKRKGEHDAFSFAGREIRVEPLNAKWARVRLPKIGWIKFRLTRPVDGDVREATVTRTALGWHISFTLAQNGEIADPGGTVGIDRGVSVPLMLSDGTSYTLPPSLAVTERRVIRAQRTVSRRKRGSRRHARAIRRVARLKARQARIRKHWAHEATTGICQRFGGVVVEALRTRNMTRTARGTREAPGRNVRAKSGLNRAILGVGWHRIETMLAYKAARFERVDPAYTSQTCAPCGAVDRRSRESQAVFVCAACGHRDNADRNAARVILSRGNTAVLDVEGKVLWHPCEASTSEFVLEIPIL